MILYRPTDGDPYTQPIQYRPKTCFIMTQTEKPLPSEITTIRQSLSKSLTAWNVKEIDATSLVTGRDFLMKIWGIIITVPLGIAIITRGMKPKTLANIFYEVGLLQSYGKETLVIKAKDAEVPSDFVRTEYVDFDRDFKTNLDKFLKSMFGLPNYFEQMADELENDPLLAIDYLRRSYLISGDGKYRQKAKKLYANSSIKERANNSVEMLLLKF